MAQRTLKSIELSDLPKTIQDMKRAAEFDTRMFKFGILQISVLLEFKMQIFFVFLYLVGFIWFTFRFGITVSVLLLVTAVFASLVSIIGVMILQSRDHTRQAGTKATSEKTLDILAHSVLFLVWPVATWGLVRKGITQMKQLYPDLRKDARMELFEELSEAIDQWNKFLACTREIDPEELERLGLMTSKEYLDLENILRSALSEMHVHLSSFPLHIPQAEMPEECRKIWNLFDDFDTRFRSMFDDEKEDTTHAQ